MVQDRTWKYLVVLHLPRLNEHTTYMITVVFWHTIILYFLHTAGLRLYVITGNTGINREQLESTGLNIINVIVTLVSSTRLTRSGAHKWDCEYEHYTSC